MEYVVNVHSLFIWVTSVITGSLSVVFFAGSKGRAARLFSWGALFFSVWAAATGFLVSTKQIYSAYFLMRFTYFLGVIIASFFLNFFQSFPGDNKCDKKFVFFSYFNAVVFAFLFFCSDLMVHDISYDDNINMWQWKMGSLSWLFDFYFFGVFTYGIVKLTKKIKESQNTLLKRNLLYMLITIILGILPPSIFDIIFLNYGVFKFYWIGPITGIFWVIVIGYSMLKYQQMNVRLVFSEVFVVAMVVIFSINIFVDLPYPFFGKVLLPIIFCLVGYFLIRSILNESERREEVINLNHALADLNQNLAQKVEAQTKEIRKAYEVEKRAKEEIERLDQNKSDFIIITQHHLRTPLSQIRWYLDSIASGLYGPVSREISGAIESVTIVTDKLSKILNHFLDISRLKVGHNILNLEPVNLKNLIDSVVYEFRLEIKKKTISINFFCDTLPDLDCDPEKIKDVFVIVLDNAIKYNKVGGVIDIECKEGRKGFVVSITNTGLMLSSTDLSSIFKDTFYRSADAKKMNPAGMGVSLLVARTIIQAHKGSISLDVDERGLSRVSLQFKKI